MRTRLPKRAIALLPALALALVAVGGLATSSAVSPSASAVSPSAALPPGFFGIAPQTPITEEDAERMRAARIGAVRWPLAWSGVQLTRKGGYEWGAFDEIVEQAARQRLRVLPFVYASPDWATGKYTRMPVANARQRSAWVAFLRAAVERYGPRGEFWREHWAGSGDFVPKLPLRQWQIWNEANFFYFAEPVSPTRYAQLLKLSARTIKGVDPGAEILLSGLFGEPNGRPPRAMDAVDFLERLYRVPGIEQSFDAAALHPYAEDAETLAAMAEGMRATILDNNDRRTRLYMTEMGWGSQNNPNLVSFEQGTRFQIKEMRAAYAYLIDNRHRLNLKGTYWFTWKDIEDSCNFCDSTGFFRVGPRLKPKSAWHAFVDMTGGRARP
ncbi:MAG TPA: hypothetical protein VNP96_05160 [Solirubrobacterales bacterium]|nr:hypothetical protein [Solirubrobacterales bacterium]